MKEEDLERTLDQSVAKFESWYASLPLAVRVLGDIICLDVTIYIAAWVSSYFGLFGLSPPSAWPMSIWGYVLVGSAALCLVYELITTKLRKA